MVAAANMEKLRPKSQNDDRRETLLAKLRQQLEYQWATLIIEGGLSADGLSLPSLWQRSLPLLRYSAECAIDANTISSLHTLHISPNRTLIAGLISVSSLI